MPATSILRTSASSYCQPVAPALEKLSDPYLLFQPPLFGLLTAALRKFIAFLLAFCLPLHALAGLAMPWQMRAQPSSAVHEGAHCAMAAPSAVSDARVDTPTAADGAACERCAICHLACSGILPSPESTVAGGARQSVFIAASERQPASYVPEEPNPPPVVGRF